MWTVRASLVIMASLLVVGMNAARPAAVVAAEATGPQDAVHQVMPGDDLHLIAGYYYGDARRWERIWQANRDRVPNPNRIEQGVLLRIPNAVVPSEPYADFVARARRPAGPSTAPAAPVAPPPPSPTPAPRP